jgi:hypothetical protein
MSLLQWLKKPSQADGSNTSRQFSKPRTLGLPDPNKEKTKDDAAICAAANAAIEKDLQSTADSKLKRGKRGCYHRYDDKTRANMAKYANEHGLKAASVHFSGLLGHNVSYTTIQSIQKHFKRQLTTIPDPCGIECLPPAKRGRPLLLGEELDAQVCRHLTAIRKAGGIVNRRITISTALGIIRARKPSLLIENGGVVNVNKFWADSILARLQMTRRRGTKAAKKLPENFDEMKANFLERISSKVRRFSIPVQLIINLDETGARIVPVSAWTLEKKGAKSVPITSIDDKREITVVLACTAAGELLCPQIIYQGSTERCHPPETVNFPEGWDIWHSKSHWCTHETMTRFIVNVLEPWATKVKFDLDFPENQRGLVILDVYKAHRTPDVLEEFSKCCFEVQYVPANCTSELQPLDLSVNKVFKDHLKNSFTNWYGDCVAEAIKEFDDDVESAVAALRPDLRLSTLKPIHARWLIDSISHLNTTPSIVCRGWEEAGIFGALQSLINKQDTIDPTTGESCDKCHVEDETVPTDTAAMNSIQNLLKTYSHVTEYYLDSSLCQSRLDGRQGSNACTIIACLVAKGVLSGHIDVPEYGRELSTYNVIDRFVDTIQQGNALYDAYAKPLGSPLLSVYTAIKLCPMLDLTITLRGELAVVDAESCLSKVNGFLHANERDDVTSNFPMTAVFVAKGRSVAVIISASSVAVLDSHSHGQKGSLIALASSLESAVRYLCNRLYGGLSIHRPGDFIFVHHSSTCISNASTSNALVLEV